MSDQATASTVEPEESVKPLPKVVKYVPMQNHTGKNPYSFQDGNGVRSELKMLLDQNIPNSDTITENGKEREIRFIAAADSIYVDEQVKAGFPRDYKLQFPIDLIQMENGALVVYPPTESNKYEYLQKTNRNGSNPNRKTRGITPLFMLDDAIATNKKLLDEDRLITKAKSIIYQIENDEAKLRNVAAQLTLDMNADPQTLIINLTSIAKKSPKMIIDAYGEEKGNVAGLVWDAIEDQHISFTGSGWEWSGSHEKIEVLPKIAGRKTEESARKQLIDFLSTQAGDPTRQLLESLVKKK